MMFLALLRRPWMSYMTALGAKPRKLADDLLITTAGPDHVNKFTKCTEEMHRFLKLPGAKVAADKSILFSSTEPRRQALRKHKWAYSSSTISFPDAFRDLGAHVNMTLSPHSQTLNQRFR